MVVRREILEFPWLMPHDLEGTVTDDLVSVHIRRRTCTALDHIHGEVLVVLTLEELVTSLDDSILLLVREQP